MQCSTVVVDTIRQLLEKKCEENGIFCVDLFGPMMKLLSEKLTMPPVEVCRTLQGYAGRAQSTANGQHISEWMVHATCTQTLCCA